MAKEYVKFETPADIQKRALELLTEVRSANGVLRKGTNECTKAIERGEAALVVIAEDVDPPEIVMHLPQICAEKKVPYVYVKEKVALGKSAGLNVGSAAIAIQKAGNTSNESAIKDIVGKMAGKLQFKSEEKKEAPKEEKKGAPKKKAEKKEKEVKPAEPKPEHKPAEAKHEHKPVEAKAEEKTG